MTADSSEDEWSKFRAAHEPQEHWELRRSFLETNKGKFEELRLVCLSQAFANMEFLGCKYPAETMTLVAELSEGIVEEYRTKKQSRLQRTFVKASDAAERKTKGINNNPSEKKQNVVFTPASHVQQNPSHLHKNIQNTQVVQSKNKGIRKNTNNLSGSSINPSVTASSSSSQILGMLTSAMENYEILPGMKKMEESTKRMKLSSGPSLSELQEILSTYPSSQLTIKKENALLADLHGFYVIQKASASTSKLESDSISTLTHSLQACHKDNVLNFTFPPGVHIGDKGISPTKCDFVFGKNKNLVIHGFGKGQKEAKKDASEKALHFFKLLCPILEVKETILAKRKVERQELIADLVNENQAIDSPVGKNLLLKMGWKGGGLGIKEDGISQAIDVVASIGYRGRTGLGKDAVANGNTGQFKKNLMTFLNGEARSYGEFDIEFSPDFTSEERKIIHELATVSGCYKSKSHGKGTSRFLVLSRKIDLNKLVQETLDNGGETTKYKVILPKCFQV